MCYSLDLRKKVISFIFKGLTNGCMTDTEKDSHFFLRQPWICFYS